MTVFAPFSIACKGTNGFTRETFLHVYNIHLRNFCLSECCLKFDSIIFVSVSLSDKNSMSSVLAVHTDNKFRSLMFVSEYYSPKNCLKLLTSLTGEISPMGCCLFCFCLESSGLLNVCPMYRSTQHD